MTNYCFESWPNPLRLLSINVGIYNQRLKDGISYMCFHCFIVLYCIRHIMVQLKYVLDTVE